MKRKEYHTYHNFQFKHTAEALKEPCWYIDVREDENGPYIICRGSLAIRFSPAGGAERGQREFFGFSCHHRQC